MSGLNSSKKIIRNNKKSKIKKNKINRKSKKSKRNQSGGQPAERPRRRSSTNLNRLTNEFDKLNVSNSNKKSTKKSTKYINLNKLRTYLKKQPNKVPSQSRNLRKQINEKSKQYQNNYEHNMKLFKQYLKIPYYKYRFYQKFSNEDKEFIENYLEKNFFPDPRTYYNTPLNGAQAKKKGYTIQGNKYY